MFLVVACLALPLSALTNLFVKKPFAELVASVIGTAPRLSPETPDAYTATVLVFGAFAEEVVKLSPLVVPALRRRIGDGETAVAGIAAGIGFGIGEALYVGAALATREEYASRSVLDFQPFISERIAATYLHALLTSIVLSSGFRVRGVLVGLCLTGSLHVLANAGALLYQVGALPGWLASLEFGLVLVLATVLWVRLRRRGGADAGPMPSQVLWHR